MCNNPPDTRPTRPDNPTREQQHEYLLELAAYLERKLDRLQAQLTAVREFFQLPDEQPSPPEAPNEVDKTC